MLDIYTKYGDKINITPTELGEWADKFEQLNKVLYDAEYANQILDNKIPLFMALVTAFQQAEALVADILENAPAEIIEAFYHDFIFLDAYSLQCIGMKFATLACKSCIAFKLL